MIRVGIGKGWGFGANISATFHAGDFAISGGIGIMNYGAHAGSGEKGWEYIKSALLSYDSKVFSMKIGTNKWSGLHAQQTGIIGFGSGDFSLSYENDGAPFGHTLGDNHDRFRTAAVNLTIGEFSAGFNLFTGERTSDSYEESGENSWDSKRMKEGGCYSNGAYLPYSYVQEKGTRYRLGAAYIGWENYRIGIDSDRYIRHPIQNVLAHKWISPQPGFQVLSLGINPYLQYQTRNKFTSW